MLLITLKTYEMPKSKRLRLVQLKHSIDISEILCLILNIVVKTEKVRRKIDL